MKKYFLIIALISSFSALAYAQVEIRDGSNNQKYMKAGGAGSSSNPYTPVHIDYPHHKVHEGDFYTISHIFNTIATSSSAEILMHIGSTYENHAVFDASAGGDAEFYIYEGTTASSSGTTLPAYNNNRSSANTVEASYFYSPAVSDAGTAIYKTFIPGGGFFGAGGSDGGPVRSGTELILKPDTLYLIRLVNTSGGNQDLSISAGFYEE